MPIKPENAARYPRNWPQIRERIRERAGHMCEQCGVGNYWWGYRDREGRFVLTGFNEAKAVVWPALAATQWPPAGAHVFEIVCTVAHLDHQPENVADENLKLLCQKCHLAYDAKHHAQTAYQTRREGKAVDMFVRETVR
jgi:hypothetical protein